MGEPIKIEPHLQDRWRLRSCTAIEDRDGRQIGVTWFEVLRGPGLVVVTTPRREGNDDRINDDQEIVRALTRLPELLAALQPFADFHGRNAPDRLVITQGSAMAKRQLTMGDCRVAAELLTGGE